MRLHGLGVLPEGFLQPVFVHLGFAEGFAAQAVGQHQGGGLPDVRRAHCLPAPVGRQGLGHLEHEDVGPVAVHPLVHADGGDEPQEIMGEAHPGQALPGSQNGLADEVLLPLPGGGKTLGVGLEGQAALHHGHAGVEIVKAGHFDAQPETVQELGPELPLLGVHGAHQDEAGRVGEGNPLPLHHVDPHGRGVQQHVD